MTRNRPKCLIEFGGVPLLEHQLCTLADAGIDNVIVVVGYMAHAVQNLAGKRVQYVHNKEWARTNSLYSLSLCRESICSPMLVMNCDVLAHPEITRRVLCAKGSSFAIDSTSGGDAEHMKVELCDGFLTSMSKDLPRDRTHGENVGVLHFEADDARVLFREAASLLDTGRRNLWMAAAVQRTASLVPLRSVDVAGLPWIEIDFPQDVARADHGVFPRLPSGTGVDPGQRLKKRSRGELLPPYVAGVGSDRAAWQGSTK